MFCPKCGKEMADTAAFCPGCGNPVNGQAAPASAPVATAVAQPSVFMVLLNKFLAIFKSLFTPNVVKVVGEQSKNTGLEWVFGIALSVLSFAFAMPVNILQTVSQMTDGAANDEFPFFSFFGASILVAILVLGAVVAGLWLLTKLVAKKNVPWPCVLNMVATATLPLSLCYIANMLLGLIWWSLPVLVSIVALFMTGLLLYAGFQKLEKPEVSPFYPFAVFLLAVVVIALVFSTLLYKGSCNVWTDSEYGLANIIATFAYGLK